MRDELNDDGFNDQLMSILSPLFEYRFIMVGGSYYTGAASKTYNKMKHGAEIFLVRQPDNAYDKNAIAVCTDRSLSFIVGYVPRRLAASFSPIMDKAIKIVRSKSARKQQDTVVLIATILRDEQHDLLEISDAMVVTDYNYPVKNQNL